MPPGAWADGADLYYSASLNAVFVDDTQSGMQSNLPEFPPPGDDWGGDGDTNWVYQSQSHQIPSFPDSTNLYIAILSASAVPTGLANLALVNTSSNLVYMIQTSTNLNYTNWYDEGVVIGAPGTNTPFATFIGERTNQLFYRAYLLSTNPVGAIATLASGANCIASVNHGGTNTYSAFLGSLVGFSPPIYSLNFGFGDWDFMGSVYKTLAKDLAGHWENTPFPFPNEPQFDHQNAIGITFSEDTLATMTNLFLSGYSGVGNPISSLDLRGAAGIQDVECYGCPNLEYVDVTYCPSLRRACFEFCAVSGVLDCSGDTNLVDIRGAWNRLNGVTFGNGSGPLVKHLCVHDNPFTGNIDLSSLTNLQDLFLWDANQTGALTFPGTNLVDVEIYTNGFTSVDVSGQRNLMWLYANSNALSSVLLTNCVNLHEVELQNNQLGNDALDNILAALDASGMSGNTNHVFLDHNPGYPSASGLQRKSNLYGRGVVDITLPTPPYIDVGGGWTNIQAAYINGGNYLSFSRSNAIGNLLICCMKDYNCDTGDIGITDSLHNTWIDSGAGLVTYSSGGQDCAGNWGAGYGGLRVFYCTNCQAGANTVVVTNNTGCHSGPATISMEICEWTGAAASLADAVASTNNATTLTGPNGLSAGQITTTQSNDMVFTFGACRYDVLTDASTGSTNLNAGAYAYGQYQRMLDYGNITPTITAAHGSGETYGMISIAFKHR